MHKNDIEDQFASTFKLQTTASSPKVARHLFTSTTAFKNERYDDLESFRQQIEQSKAGLHHQPYTNSKKSVFLYRSVFCGFCLLFCILTLFALSLPSTIQGGLLFGTSTAAKGLVIGICMMLSLGSAFLAIMMQPEKEAVYQCARKAKAHLNVIYGRKSLRLGLKRIIALFGKQRLQALALKQLYQESLDKINDKKDEALHLVHRIATAETLDKAEKESLLNQAIEEFNEKLMLLTHSFRHASIPHFADH